MLKLKREKHTSQGIGRIVAELWLDPRGVEIRRSANAPSLVDELVTEATRGFWQDPDVTEENGETYPNLMENAAGKAVREKVATVDDARLVLLELMDRFPDGLDGSSWAEYAHELLYLPVEQLALEQGTEVQTENTRRAEIMELEDYRY